MDVKIINIIDKMANYINMDMTLGDLTNYILTEYKEPIAGSLEMSVDNVEDKINETYMDIFNSPELVSFDKRSTYSFSVVEDQLLDGDILAGAVTLNLVDASEWPNTGYACIDGHDFFTYTGKSSNQLTGVTGLKTNHLSNENVKLGYSVPADINYGGIENPILTSLVPYTYVEPGSFFNNTLSFSYTIFKNKIFVSSSDSRIFSFFYEVLLTALSTTSDKPSLIPGSFRPALLGSGAIAKLGVRDDMRSGWDYHFQRYQVELKKFIAKQNNPVKSRPGATRPTIYD